MRRLVRLIEPRKNEVSCLCRLTAAWKSRNKMDSEWVKTRGLVAPSYSTIQTFCIFSFLPNEKALKYLRDT